MQKCVDGNTMREHIDRLGFKEIILIGKAAERGKGHLILRLTRIPWAMKEVLHDNAHNI